MLKVFRLNTIVVICILSVLLCLLPGCGKRPTTGVIIAGSTSVQPFAEALAEEYMREHLEIIIDVQGGGSSAGIMAAQTSTADIGMSSRLLKDSEKKLWFKEIARDGLAVIVHPSNNISSLTLKQVRDIYTGAISDWSQLGGTKSKIHVITREDGSGTRSSFEGLVMDKNEINPRSIVQDSNGAVRQLVVDDPAAIGFISLGLVNIKVKALELDGIVASRENVINGTYGLSRPFIFITREAPAGNAKLFIDFVLSEKGKKMLATEGLVTMEDGVSK